MSDPTAQKSSSTLGAVENSVVTEHLKMIQTVINRLAADSTQCKNWCISIVSAIVAFAGATKNEKIVALAIIPLAIFGVLDATYLAHEKAYRDLYNAIAAKFRDGSYALSDCFTLTAPADSGHYVWAHRSWSVWPIYLGLVVLYMLVRVSGLLMY